MRDREKLAKVRKLHSDASSIESILVFLRREHTSKVESIRLVHLGAGISLGDAKKVVFTSQTWSDRFRSDEDFLDSFLQDVEVACASEAA